MREIVGLTPNTRVTVVDYDIEDAEEQNLAPSLIVEPKARKSLDHTHKRNETLPRQQPKRACSRPMVQRKLPHLNIPPNHFTNGWIDLNSALALARWPSPLKPTKGRSFTLCWSGGQAAVARFGCSE